MYWAVAGQGAWVRDKASGQQRRLRSAPFDLGDTGLVVVGSAGDDTEKLQRILGQLSDPVYKGLGSSLKMLMVSADVHFPAYLAEREVEQIASTE